MTRMEILKEELINVFIVFILSSLTLSISLIAPIDGSVLFVMVITFLVLLIMKSVEGLKRLNEKKGEE